MTAQTTETATRSLQPSEARAALWSVRVGGGDVSLNDVEISPTARAALGPLLSALRWGAVLFGMVFAAPLAFDGELQVVVALAIALWWTCWRSFRPLRLASPVAAVRAFVLVDAAVFAFAAGISGGASSSFVGTAIAAATVVTIGWGTLTGVRSLTVSVVVIVVSSWLFDSDADLLTVTAAVVLCAAIALVVVCGALRRWLIDAERRRRELARQVETLGETNDLLVMLNQAARTIPGSLDHRDVIDAIVEQVQSAFAPSSIVVLERSSGEGWVTSASIESEFPTYVPDAMLPALLGRAVGKEQAVLSSRCEMMRTDIANALAVPLIARGSTVGVVALGHVQEGTWTQRDTRLLDSLAEILALSLDNVRRYAQLRTVGATQERERIARELHDRLGQMLAYMSLEIERVMDSTGGTELERLHSDVQRSIDELRETLRQLRSNVTPGRPFVEVAGELLEEFGARQQIRVAFEHSGDANVEPGIEQELLRILQEALNNTAKHAIAALVTVTYQHTSDEVRLDIVDDGLGFDLHAARRDDAWGMIGMHERAASIDGRLEVHSVPRGGTTVSVRVPVP